MSDEKVVSIFSQYKTREAAPTATVNSETYHAAKVGNERTPRIKINYSNGHVDAISYAYIKNMLSVSPDHLILYTSTGVVFIRGKNIRELFDSLLSEHVYSLHPFDPAVHKSPKEGAPVIDSIEWKTTEELKNT